MSSRAVEQIKERLPIADIVSSYIKLDRAGANFKGKCPFHNEKTPSFMVSPDRGSYYCFGCGAKGDIFTFVQEFEKLDFKEALSMLAERAGVQLPKYSGNEADIKEEDERERLRKIMDAATSYFESGLKEDDKSISYLQSRGLDAKTIEEWRLGSAAKGWNHLYDHLKASGYSDEDIEKAGLAKKGNHGFYDRFRSRIMFPISDPGGKVIAFTGRFKEWDKEEGKDPEAKYLNSPDTILFDKSRTLYGFHKAKSSVSKWKFWLLVEGQMDLLMCHQAGFNNAVATSGTALTKEQLQMMARFSKNILIAYDGDKAGVEAARRAWVLALSLGIDVKMARMPEGNDPADLIVKDVAAFKEALRKSSHIIEFYLAVLLSRGLPARELGKAVEADVLPYVKAVESAIDRAHFISLIASRTGIKEDALLDSLAKAPATVAAPLRSAETNASIVTKHNFSKRRLTAGIYLLLKDEEKARNYIENLDESKEQLLFEVEEWLAQSKQSPESSLPDLLKHLEKESLQHELEEHMRQWARAADEGDEEKARELLIKSDAVRKKLGEYR